MQINVTVEELDLSAPTGTARRWDRNLEDYEEVEVTLAERVVETLVAKVAKTGGLEDLRSRVALIRDQEIEKHVIPMVTQAVSEPVQRTNEYGRPIGEPTTLKELIIKEAQATLTKRDGFGHGSETFVQKIIREQVQQALRTELSEAIKAEKAKVVAAVRAQAADILSKALEGALKA